MQRVFFFETTHISFGQETDSSPYENLVLMLANKKRGR